MYDADEIVSSVLDGFPISRENFRRLTARLDRFRVMNARVLPLSTGSLGSYTSKGGVKSARGDGASAQPPCRN